MVLDASRLRAELQQAIRDELLPEVVPHRPEGG
jgi:hypothetical protein